MWAMSDVSNEKWKKKKYRSVVKKNTVRAYFWYMVQCIFLAQEKRVSILEERKKFAE